MSTPDGCCCDGTPGSRPGCRSAATVTPGSLFDLRPWPDAALLHAVIVPVPAKGDSPAHRHADLRFVLATDHPDDATPERPDAPLRWVTLEQAPALTSEVNLRESIARVQRLLTGRSAH
jgi:hypothetical protein